MKKARLILNAIYQILRHRSFYLLVAVDEETYSEHLYGISGYEIEEVAERSAELLMQIGSENQHLQPN